MSDHSQYGEGTFLYHYFNKFSPRHRFLVDVGALGIELSNTFEFLQKGWGGLVIEAFPQEQYLKPMKKALEENTKVTFIEGLAIGDYSGVATGFLNKIRGHRSLVHKEEENFGTCQVPVQTLEFVLRHFHVPLDFDLLSIDAEGLDRRILEHLMSQSAYRPQVIVYEKDSAPTFIEKYGYGQIFETKGNLIYGLVAHH